MASLIVCYRDIIHVDWWRKYNRRAKGSLRKKRGDLNIFFLLPLHFPMGLQELLVLCVCQSMRWQVRSCIDGLWPSLDEFYMNVLHTTRRHKSGVDVILPYSYRELYGYPAYTTQLWLCAHTKKKTEGELGQQLPDTSPWDKRLFSGPTIFTLFFSLLLSCRVV